MFKLYTLLFYYNFFKKFHEFFFQMQQRGKYRLFVGNTQEISTREVREKFEEFGTVTEVDLKG